MPPAWEMKQTVKKLKIGANFHHDLIFVVHDFHSHAVIPPGREN